jgi:hypothetical protein
MVYRSEGDVTSLKADVSLSSPYAGKTTSKRTRSTYLTFISHRGSPTTQSGKPLTYESIEIVSTVKTDKPFTKSESVTISMSSLASQVISESSSVGVKGQSTSLPVYPVPTVLVLVQTSTGVDKRMSLTDKVSSATNYYRHESTSVEKESQYTAANVMKSGKLGDINTKGAILTGDNITGIQVNKSASTFSYDMKPLYKDCPNESRGFWRW